MLDSVTNLASLLKDPTLLVTKAYVAGQWIDADDGPTSPVTHPARGDVICHLPNLGRAETARAIDAAQKAMKDWATRTGKERAAILRKWYDLMMANVDDLGKILTAEMGKPLAEAKGEVAYGASFIEWFGEEAKRVYGETIPGHQRDKRITVIKQPIGVVGSITPWNFPTRGPACRDLLGHHLDPLFRHRQGILRKPRRAQTHLHRLYRSGPHPAASGRRTGDEMFDGTGRQRALHRV